MEGNSKLHAITNDLFSMKHTKYVYDNLSLAVMYMTLLSVCQVIKLAKLRLQEGINLFITTTLHVFKRQNFKIMHICWE